MGKKSTEERKVDLRHSANNPGIGAMPWDITVVHKGASRTLDLPTYCMGFAQNDFQATPVSTADQRKVLHVV